jgi:hypothetical protein
VVHHHRGQSDVVLPPMNVEQSCAQSFAAVPTGGLRAGYRRGDEKAAGTDERKARNLYQAVILEGLRRIGSLAMGKRWNCDGCSYVMALCLVSWKGDPLSHFSIG